MFIRKQKESERRQEEINERTKIFIESLDVDDVIAHLMVAEGFTSIDEIANSTVEELNNIEGFDKELAEELKSRAGLLKMKMKE